MGVDPIIAEEMGLRYFQRQIRQYKNWCFSSWLRQWSIQDNTQTKNQLAQEKPAHGISVVVGLWGPTLGIVSNQFECAMVSGTETYVEDFRQFMYLELITHKQSHTKKINGSTFHIWTIDCNILQTVVLREEAFHLLIL